MLIKRLVFAKKIGIVTMSWPENGKENVTGGKSEGFTLTGMIMLSAVRTCLISLYTLRINVLVQ